jgi:hypothetical protein
MVGGFIFLMVVIFYKGGIILELSAQLFTCQVSLASNTLHEGRKHEVVSEVVLCTLRDPISDFFDGERDPHYPFPSRSRPTTLPIHETKHVVMTVELTRASGGEVEGLCELVQSM